MPDLRRLIENERLPDVRALAVVLGAYEAIRDGRAPSLAEVAGLVGTDKDTVYRAVRQFEEEVSPERKVFHKSLGRRATEVARDDDTEHLFARLRFILELVLELLERGRRPVPPQVRLGAGLTLGLHLVPSVLKAFRESDPQRKVEVYVTHALPQSLREKARDGALDLVLTSCPKKRGDWQEGVDVLASVWLPMRLLCSREHPLTRQPFSWDLLRGQTVVLLKENRDPMPAYPAQLDRLDVRIVRVESYPQAHYMVLGGGGTVCFSFPQVLSPEERSRLYAVAVPGLDRSRLCLLGSRRARGRWTRKEKEVIDELAGRFKEHLKQLEAEDAG